MMRPETNVSGIVIKAEAELPDCLAQFCKEMETEVKQGVSMGIEAKIKAWNIARKCFEHGNLAEVKTLVQIENAKSQKEKGGGAPKKPHRFLMDKLVEKGFISKRTSNNWLAGWLEAAEEAGLKPDCTEKEFMATVAHNFVQMLECKQPDPDETIKRLELPPDEQGTKAAKAALKPFLDEEGKMRCNPRAYKAWIAMVQSVIEVHGDRFVPKTK